MRSAAIPSALLCKHAGLCCGYCPRSLARLLSSHFLSAQPPILVSLFGGRRNSAKRTLDNSPDTRSPESSPASRMRKAQRLSSLDVHSSVQCSFRRLGLGDELHAAAASQPQQLSDDVDMEEAPRGAQRGSAHCRGAQEEQPQTAGPFSQLGAPGRASCPCGRRLAGEDLVLHMWDVHKIPAYIAASLLGAEFVRARGLEREPVQEAAPCELPLGR